MDGGHYIPRADAEFDVFFKNIVDYVLARVLVPNPPWTHIPPAEAEKLAASYTTWHTAYEVTLKPHTSTDTAEKNRLRGVSEKDLETFVNRFLRYDPAVTEEDKKNTGVPIRKKPSRVEPPKTRPQLTFDTSTPLRVGIYYKDEGSTRRGKPEHVHAAFLRWDFRDTTPAHPNDLKNAITNTEQPAIIEFSGSDRGKKGYAAGAWQIEREGEIGPWSDIEMFIVP